MAIDQEDISVFLTAARINELCLSVFNVGAVRSMIYSLCEVVTLVDAIVSPTVAVTKANAASRFNKKKNGRE